MNGIREAAPALAIEVFGTALLSCVPRPADKVEIVALRLREERALAVEPEVFCGVRLTAEREARRGAARSGRRNVTIAEIYAIVRRKLPALDADRALAAEIAVERAGYVANPAILRYYIEQRAAGRRVPFVSDSAFPPALVADILRTCGYTGDLDVVSSSDVPSGVKRHRSATPLRASRRSENSLADRVLNRLGALAALGPSPSDEDRMLRDLSYEIMGPIFLGFTQWLIERLKSAPADLVLFCARDGYFVHQAFETFGRFVALPESRYFEVSRRALVFPSIRELDERALDFLCANNAPLELAQFFSRVGIDVSNYPDQLAASGLRLGSRIYDSDSRRRLRELFASLAEPVLAQAQSERAAMLAYLQQCGAGDARDLVMVDMGWGGTLQRALADALASEGKAPSIRAYYLSTDERIRRLGPRAGTAEAWFANAAQPEWMHESISPGYWLLEIAFSAEHGTVLGYQRDPHGRIQAVHHAYDPDAPNARAARLITAASRELIERWSALFGGVGPAITMPSAFRRFQRFVTQPSREEARFFGDIVHVGGLGATAETIPIAAPPGLSELARHPRAVLRGYRESLWQVAFLQRLIGSEAVAHRVIALRDALRPARKFLKRRRRLAGSTGG